MVEEKKEKTYVETEPNTDLTKLFIDLQEGVPTDEIESLCMECRKQGQTKFMYTKIPFFREIILSSFNCNHCGNKNNEVQFGGSLQDLGVKYTLTCHDMKSLNRSVVKSEFATISIPELDFEIPPQTQKGSIKTVEGFLMSAIDGISELQEQRRKYNPEIAQKIDEFLEKLKVYMEGKKFPFTFVVTDPSGNSYISSESVGGNDNFLKRVNYMRTSEDFVAMGYNIDQAELQR